MRIAAICLAYLRRPEGVDLLAGYFAETGTDLFVHVDAKVDAAVYEEAAKGWPAVHLLKNRSIIHWGGFNTVRAIVRGLEEASIFNNYDRYLVLTEDTVPVVSRSSYLKLMASTGEFIDSRRPANPDIFERYKRFFYFDSGATSPRPNRTLEREITPQTLLDLMRLQNLRARGKAVIPQIYHGSGWLGLSAASVDAILTSYHQDDHLRESFEFSAIPEEQYFHTILGELRQTQPLVFADWSRQPTPYIFRSPEEIAATNAQGCPFLRKVALGNKSIAAFVQTLS